MFPGTIGRGEMIRTSDPSVPNRSLCRRFPHDFADSSCRVAGRPTRVTVYTLHYKRAQMTTTLSVRIDNDTKNQLEALAKRARRSKSFPAAEAIAAYVEAERWQLDEIHAGLQELDKGRDVAHEDVSKWLRSWGKKRERKAPRA